MIRDISSAFFNKFLHLLLILFLYLLKIMMDIIDLNLFRNID
ncbi:protein of unknown function [Clostridium beijerinckii]|nr:protein of unknown function [Clostridium beijerinckii]